MHRPIEGRFARENPIRLRYSNHEFAVPFRVLPPRLGRDSIQNLKQLVFRRLVAVGEELGHGKLRRPAELSVTRPMVS